MSKLIYIVVASPASSSVELHTRILCLAVDIYAPICRSVCCLGDCPEHGR